MRIKFLTFIASFFFIAITISSCLDSNNSTIELSSDATVRAFGIDTIHGKSYKFTIDQLSRMIYNRDSLPMGSDTILDKILIDTFTVSGWVTAGVNDTVLNTSDSLDLRGAINSRMTFKVHAPDGSTFREYMLKINVHLQDPDSLKWGQVASLPPTSTNRKSVMFNESILVYEGEQMYEGTIDNQTLAVNWSNARTANIAPESIVVYQGKLYATSEGNVYFSDNGTDWTKSENLSGEVSVLTHAFTSSLAAIKSYEGIRYFCRADGENPETQGAWVQGEAVPEDFIATNLSSARYYSSSNVEFAILTGGTAVSNDDEELTTPWFTSINNSGWAPMNISAGSTDTYPACPHMEHPTIIRYNNHFYIFGGDFTSFHQSVDGMVWQVADKKFAMPASFKDKGGYTAVLDESPIDETISRQCIWIMWNDGEVWRGRLNKYGFQIQ